MKVRPLVYDDQRVLKLAGARRIQPKVGLQRNGHGHPRRHIHKGTAGPNGAVQSGEFVVRGLYQLHKVLLDHLRIRAVHSAFQVCIDHALGGHFLSHIVVHQLGVILGAYTGKGLALCLGNAQALKCIFNIFGHIGPLGAHFGVGAHIGYDVVHIQSVNGRAPLGHPALIVNLQGLEPKQLHPCRIVLLIADLLYDLRGQTRLQLVGIFFVVFYVIDRAVNVCHIGFFFHREHLFYTCS